MDDMKKTLLVGCALMAMTQVVNAQDMASSVSRPPKFGVEVGLTGNTFIDHYQGQTSNSSFKAGFHAGVLGDILLTDHLYFQPGLRYAMKGGQHEAEWTVNTSATTSLETKTKDKLTLHYIEMPLNLVWKFGEDDAKVFAGVGGYIGALVGADKKYKVKETTMVGEQESEVEYDGTRGLNIGNGNTDDITRMDYGLNALLGYNITPNWFIKANAQFGLRNLVSAGQNNINSRNSVVVPGPTGTDASMQNLGVGISVGYMF
jgi:opacity protein-like surface antigen